MLFLHASENKLSERVFLSLKVPFEAFYAFQALNFETRKLAGKLHETSTDVK